MQQLEGWHKMSNEEYHLRPEISSSILNYFLQTSPAHYQAKYIDKTVPRTAPTKDMILGTQAHMAILEPELFSQLIVKPDKSGEGKADCHTKRVNFYKGQCEECWENDNKNKELITLENYNKVVRMAEVFHKHPKSSRMIKECTDFELPGFFTCPYSGLRVRIMPDGRNNLSTIYDYKTTKDASDKGFGNSVVNYGYLVQMAFYLVNAKISGMEPWLWVAQEKEEPYIVRVIRPKPEDIQTGIELYKRGMDRLALCHEFDDFPSYENSSKISDLKLPGWYKP